MPRKRSTYNIEHLKLFAKNKDGECLSTEYNTANNKYDWKCNKCKTEWSSLWVSVKDGSWCPTCGTIKQSLTIALNKGEITADQYIILFEKKIKRYLRKQKPQIYIPIVNSVQACKLIACKPARQLWLDIFVENMRSLTMVDYKSVAEGIVKIEDLMYKKNIYHKSSIVVGASLYLKSSLSQTKASKWIGINNVSMRRLISRLKLVKIKPLISMPINTIIKAINAIKMEMNNIFNQLEISIDYIEPPIITNIPVIKMTNDTIDNQLLSIVEKGGPMRRKDFLKPFHINERRKAANRMHLLVKHGFIQRKETNRGYVYWIDSTYPPKEFMNKVDAVIKASLPFWKDLQYDEKQVEEEKEIIRKKLINQWKINNYNVKI